MGPTESFYLSDGEFLWVRRRVHTVLTALRVPTALTVPRVPIALVVSSSHSSLTALTAPIATTATTASTPPRESTLLVRIPKGQTHKGVQSVSSSQSVSQFKSLSQVRRSRSSSRRLFIRLILSIRFSQIRIWSIATSTTTREPSSIRLAVRIWARSRQSSYSATLLVCVIIRSCWKIYKL